jgi:hypothetical protein
LLWTAPYLVSCNYAKFLLPDYCLITHDCLPAWLPNVQEYLAVDSSPEAVLVCGWSESGGAAAPAEKKKMGCMV